MTPRGALKCTASPNPYHFPVQGSRRHDKETHQGHFPRFREVTGFTGNWTHYCRRNVYYGDRMAGVLECALRQPPNSTVLVFQEQWDDCRWAFRDRRKAIPTSVTVVSLFPDSPSFLSKRAAAYLSGGSRTIALKHASRAVELDPLGRNALMCLVRAPTPVWGSPNTR